MLFYAIKNILWFVIKIFHVIRFILSYVIKITLFHSTFLGAAHMLSITAFGGTARVSGLRLIRDMEDMGATFSSSSDREKVSALNDFD